MKPTKPIFIALLISVNGFCQNDTVKVEYKNIEVDCLKNTRECYDCMITRKKKGKVYKADFKTKGDCVEYKTAGSFFTIVGSTISCGGCSPPEKSIEVIKIPSKKKYVFTFQTKENGLCAMRHLAKFWIMIPKIENGYTM